MNESIKPIPEGFHTVTPYILVSDVPKALEFYKKAFGAEVLYKLEIDPGIIAHAEFKIGNSMIMISGITPEIKGSPGCRYVGFMVYVNDVDKVARDVVLAGMKVIREVSNQPYGDRIGTFEDPFGHVWSIATRIENVSREEMSKRMKKLYGKGEKK